MLHGYVPRGEEHYCHVLTEDLVQKIRLLYMKGFYPSAIQKLLHLKMSRSGLNSVINYTNWKHVPDLPITHQIVCQV